MRARLVAFLAALSLVAPGALVLGAVPSAAAPTTLNLSCQAQTPIGAQPADQTITVDVNAPATVAPNNNFTITTTSAPTTAPTSNPSPVGNVTINALKDFVLRIPVPANSTFVSASLSGGSNYGAGTPTVTLTGSNVVMSIPGPIAGGTTFQFPSLNVQLKATGAEGSTVQTRLGGTSFADPGFELTVNADLPIYGTRDLPTDCFPPAPNPVLSTTTILGPDTAPPAITITTPANHANYPLGANIPAAYACADGPFGSGVATCNGTVANGAAIDTTSLGTHTFTVTATDNAGNGPSTVTHTYEVVEGGNDVTPPTITLTTPASGAVYAVGQSVAASYSCSDTETGIASCNGNVANGAAIDTATAGAKSFTVDALDNQGNPHRVVHTYRVMASTGVQQNFDAIQPLGSDPNRIPLNCDTLGGAFDESIPVNNPPKNLAPLQTAQNGTFSWDFGISQDVIPPLTDVTGSGILYRFNAPTNGTFTAVQFTGAGLNVTNPTISIVNGKIELHLDDVSGNYFLDKPFYPPPFRATIKATGAVGSVVKTQMDYFQVQTVSGGIIPATSHCPAGDPDENEANPILTNTTIVDVTPPTATIASPGHGAVYAPGATIVADYSCSTDAVTCTGDVADGATLPATTSGAYQFHVTATDANGNSAQEWVTYRIGQPSVSAGDASVDEGPSAQLEFPVTLTNPSAVDVTISYATSDGSATDPDDYTGDSGTVVFHPGDPLTKTVVIDVADDTAYEGDETIALALTSVTNATLADADATGTILENDPPPFTVTGGSVPENAGSPVQFTVTLAGPTNVPVTLDYTTVDGTATAPADYTAKSGQLTFAPGDDLAQDVFVPVVDDAVWEGDESFTLSVTNAASGDAGSATGTIIENEAVPPRLSIGDTSVYEGDTGGQRTVKLAVTLSKAATTVVTVKYSTVAGSASAPADFTVLTNKTLTFQPGQVFKPVTVKVKPDALVEGDETLSVVLSTPTGGAAIADGTGVVTIVDDDPSAATPQLAIGDATVHEGNDKTVTMTFPVTLSQPAVGAVTLKYSSVPGSATAPADYTAKLNKSMTFKAGQFMKVITIPVKSDAIAEATETFTLQLSNVVGADLADGTAVGTIIDND